MAELDGTLAERLTLVDAIDTLLNRGVVLVGHTTLSLAGVDLVYLGLNVLLSSVETLRGPGPPAPPSPRGRGEPLPPFRGPDGTLESDPEPSPAAPLPRGEAAGGPAPGSALPPAVRGTYSDAQRPAPPPSSGAPARVSLDGLTDRLAGAPAERPEQGLARLVLTLIELLRQVLERQAVRRMDGAGLADADVERMGVALMQLEAKMTELRELFGLTAEDINLDLGPLGRLV